ncbi:MAG: hypothetical protein ACK55H_05330 [Cyanobacteriota bacterium]
MVLPVSQSPPAQDSPPSPVPAPPSGATLADPVLCQHCGRTASNDISCQGICVADSGY